MILYTAIFNDYDKLHETRSPYRNICFSDRPIESNTWEVIVLPNEPKIHRQIKINPHLFLPEHDRSLWMDGNLVYLGDWAYFDRLGNWVMEHPHRKTIKEEAEACILLGKDKKETILFQVADYPECEVVATGIIIRENNEITRKHSELWWHEVKYNSHRDQLSFTPTAIEAGLKYNKLDFLKNCIKYGHKGTNHKPHHFR